MENSAVKIDTIFQNKTIWLTQGGMADLFEDGKLQKEATLSKMETI
jgi:hypothetical protein